jgi:hypothetical protein
MTARVRLAACDGLIRQRGCGRGLNLKILTKRYVTERAGMAAAELQNRCCLSSTALAHDIYTNPRDQAGRLCCNGQDCKPVEATVLPNGTYYLPESDDIIAADMAAPSPDDRFHHCTYYQVGNDWGGPIWDGKPKTRCFFAPMNSW